MIMRAIIINQNENVAVVLQDTPKGADLLIGDLHLTDNRDIYTHTTETRRKRRESSGGGKIGRSGGFSGTSGKF